MSKSAKKQSNKTRATVLSARQKVVSKKILTSVKQAQPKEPVGSYYDNIVLTAQDMKSAVVRYITNFRIVFLLILSIVLIGMVSYFNLPKRLNPEVKIPIVTIATVLPGASPKDVERLVTIPLEDKVRGLQGLDTVNSISQENVSVLSMQFVSTVDRDKAKDSVKSAIDSVVLPANAQKSLVEVLDFENVPVWTFALTSEGSVPDLMLQAKQLQNKLEDLSKINKVLTTGLDKQEVTVQLNQSALAQYGLNGVQLSDRIIQARSSFPGGTVKSDGSGFALNIDPSLETVQDVRELRIRTSDGGSITLGDVANVQMRSQPDQQQALLAKSGQPVRPAVMFSVYKTSTADITAAEKQTKEVVDAFISQSNTKLKVETLRNTGETIQTQFSDLLDEFKTTILLVFVVLLLFLGFRQALISCITVPLTFLSTFFIMNAVGMSINFLSLFAFLLALGLLVDDTIVVVSSMTTYFRSGRFTPKETGLVVWRDTITPIWSTTITTVWAFVPLLLSTGIIGEFIKPIPIVVTAAMVSSTAIAVLITLPLMIVLLKPSVPSRVTTLLRTIVFLICFGVVARIMAGTPVLLPTLLVFIVLTLLTRRLLPALRKQVSVFMAKRWKAVSTNNRTRVSSFIQLLKNWTEHGIINTHSFSKKYERLIFRILHNKGSRRKVIIGVIVYAVFSFALLPLGFVKNEFFPKTDEDFFYTQLELPSGATVEQSLREGTLLLNQLTQYPEVEFVTAEVGKVGGSNTVNTALTKASNQVFFTAHLKPKKERNRTSIKLAELVRSTFSAYPAGKVSVIEESGGPPAGADVQITLLGEDFDTLSAKADEVFTYLKQQPGLTNVEKSINESTSKLNFVPDQNALAEYNVSTSALGFALRTYASGFPLDAISFDPAATTDKTDVVLRYSINSPTPEGLDEIQVALPKGGTVPLSALGKFELKPNPTAISRKDFKRSISISAAARPGQSVSEANAKLQTFVKTVKLPLGFAWQTGGVNEENQKSVQSILQAMVLSAVLIMITMVIQFQSFRQALIVLIVIPFAVSSVFLAFALTGTPLSFPALIGILSLFGIVVTNSMFIVDKINLNQKEGMHFEHAISDAGASRMEPIILTKLSTVFGLLPITLADPLWRGLGGAIISGLLIASTIMLLFIPVLYYEWMKPAGLKSK